MTTRVVFIHGLWLHATSWDPWIRLFDVHGYVASAPGWPGDGESVVDTRQHAERTANRGVDEITRAFADVIRTYDERPVVIGHSFGGLIAEKLLGAGLAAAAVALDPAQMRGVLPLPFTQVKSAFPALGNPSNYRRAVALTPKQFRYAFGNTLTEDESNALYDQYAIPGPARPLFEAAFANFNARTAAQVDVDKPGRGPLLITGGGADHTVPEVVSRASHRRYRRARTVNDYRVFPDRGHSLTIDHGWRDVAEAVLAWLEQKGIAPMRATTADALA